MKEFFQLISIGFFVSERGRQKIKRDEKMKHILRRRQLVCFFLNHENNWQGPDVNLHTPTSAGGQNKQLRLNCWDESIKKCIFHMVYPGSVYIRRGLEMEKNL
jgi:hypothetical protein